MRKLLWLVPFCLWACAGNNQQTSNSKWADNSRYEGKALNVVFDSVPSEQEKILRGDLKILGGLPKGTGDRYILEASEFSGAGINEWLGQRVKYILGRDFDFSANLVEPSTSQLGYSLGASLAADDYSTTVMMNVGGHLYNVAVGYSGVWYSIRIGGTFVLATSPRIGIIMIGDELFGSRMISGSALNSFANALIRLGTILHEARHDDGRGDITTFGHVKCTHWEKQSKMCDAYLNGPNAVTVAFLNYAINACPNCTYEELEGLRGRISNASSRILPEASMADVTAVGTQGGYYGDTLAMDGL